MPIKFLVFLLIAACLAAGVLPTSNAPAAEIFTKDQELEGSVVGGTAEGVEFETIYSKGTIVISWADTENIRSDKEFLILHAEADTVVGRIWDLKDDRLLVGKSLETAVRIPVENILRSVPRDQYNTSRLERRIHQWLMTSFQKE